MQRNHASEWHSLVGQLIDQIGDDAFPATLLAAIERVVEFDDALILAYHKNDVPIILFDQLREVDRKIFYKSYFSGVYLASPFYHAFTNGYASGIYKIGELAPSGFSRSEYYRRYYRHIGTRDLLSYLFHMPDQWALLISIGRRSSAQAFGKREVESLREIEPVLHALSTRHWRNPWQQNTQTLHQQFQARFNGFGAQQLTQRELDVVRLLLHGHSSKSVAQALKITSETVRVHRKNIHQKLNVRSHGGLFSLFISYLTCESEAE